LQQQIAFKLEVPSREADAARGQTPRTKLARRGPSQRLSRGFSPRDVGLLGAHRMLFPFLCTEEYLGACSAAWFLKETTRYAVATAPALVWPKKQSKKAAQRSANRPQHGHPKRTGRGKRSEQDMRFVRITSLLCARLRCIVMCPPALVLRPFFACCPSAVGCCCLPFSSPRWADVPTDDSANTTRRHATVRTHNNTRIRRISLLPLARRRCAAVSRCPPLRSQRRHRRRLRGFWTGPFATGRVCRDRRSGGAERRDREGFSRRF